MTPPHALLTASGAVPLPPLPSWMRTQAGLTGTALAVLAVLTVTAYLVGAYRTRRRASDGSSAPDARGWSVLEMALTVAAAGIATGVALNGMWRVFGDALGFSGPGRVALAGFLEIALMVSAIRARRSLLETGSVGVDGTAVWVLAGFSAFLASADAHTTLARVTRLGAPLVAAWMWERGLAADRRRVRAQGGVTARQSIAWRWTRQRVAVRFGLADPAVRTGSDVDRARRLARLTRARLRLAVLETSDLPGPLAWLTAQPIRRAIASWRLQRQALAAVEHLNLGEDPTITDKITTTVAAVVGLRAATTPQALARAGTPWKHMAAPEPTGPAADRAGYQPPATAVTATPTTTRTPGLGGPGGDFPREAGPGLRAPRRTAAAGPSTHTVSAKVPAEPAADAHPLVATGNRRADAVELVRRDPNIDARALTERLAGLGYNLHRRTGGRDLEYALEQIGQDHRPQETPDGDDGAGRDDAAEAKVLAGTRS